jgi:hypothetical protein
VVEIALACERWLARQGFAGDVEDAEPDDDAAGVLQLASLGGSLAPGERAGPRVRRVVMRGGKERLCRYAPRPALAVDRIAGRPHGRVRGG